MPRILLACFFLAPVALSACASEWRLGFRAKTDLQTTKPLGLVESGRGQAAVTPAGVHWQLRLDGVQSQPRRGVAEQLYELSVAVQQPNDSAWQPIAEATLVDDEGVRLRASQLLETDTEKLRGGRHLKRFLIRFQVPEGYDFRRMQYVTVHWCLRTDGQRPCQVSSRFER